MSKVLETQAWNCNEWPRALSDQVDECMEVSDRADMSTEQVVAYAILAERERCAKAVKGSMMSHWMSVGAGNSALTKIMSGEK